MVYQSNSHSEEVKVRNDFRNRNYPRDKDDQKRKIVCMGLIFLSWSDPSRLVAEIIRIFDKIFGGLAVFLAIASNIFGNRVCENLTDFAKLTSRYIGTEDYIEVYSRLILLNFHPVYSYISLLRQKRLKILKSWHDARLRWKAHQPCGRITVVARKSTHGVFLPEKAVSFYN